MIILIVSSPHYSYNLCIKCGAVYLIDALTYKNVLIYGDKNNGFFGKRLLSTIIKNDNIYIITDINSVYVYKNKIIKIYSTDKQFYPDIYIESDIVYISNLYDNELVKIDLLTIFFPGFSEKNH